MTGPERPRECPPECLDLANAMADAVREIVRPYFRRRIAIDSKADSSPVTIADREAETAMRQMIGAAFPEHGIRGEEFGLHRPEAEWVWVLDPIDGTKSFISGSLAFGTQIALLHRGRPVLGILDQPITRERWLGRSGHPTLLNGEPVRTSDTPAIGEAIVYTSAYEQFDGERHRRFAALSARARFTRLSHDGYAAGLLALGGVDLLLESDVFDYDIMPQMPIVEGAGGIVTDWEGRPLGDRRRFETVLMAANPALHRAALALLGG